MATYKTTPTGETQTDIPVTEARSAERVGLIRVLIVSLALGVVGVSAYWLLYLPHGGGGQF